MTDFSNVAQALMQGVFVCQYSHPDFYAYLQKPPHLLDMERYLHKIGFSLSKLNDGEAYYCSYQYPQEYLTELKQQFKSIIESLKPLVSFLRLIQQATNNDDVIRAGDLLRLAEIQTIVENSPPLDQQLNKIVSSNLFKSSSSGIDGKLKQVFKRLLELDYLTQANPTRQIYQATSKWTLLQEQIDFINDVEKLSLETLADVKPVQEGLF
jgi:hypothetical protein